MLASAVPDWKCRRRRSIAVASTLLAAVLLFGDSRGGLAQQANPLKPLDTSSPRATLQSFLEQAKKIDAAFTSYRSHRTWDVYRKSRRVFAPFAKCST